MSAKGKHGLVDGIAQSVKFFQRGGGLAGGLQKAQEIAHVGDAAVAPLRRARRLDLRHQLLDAGLLPMRGVGGADVFIRAASPHIKITL
jgi:hypothetical protein